MFSRLPFPITIKKGFFLPCTSYFTMSYQEIKSLLFSLADEMNKHQEIDMFKIDNDNGMDLPLKYASKPGLRNSIIIESDISFKCNDIGIGIEIGTAKELELVNDIGIDIANLSQPLLVFILLLKYTLFVLSFSEKNQPPFLVFWIPNTKPVTLKMSAAP